MIRQFASTPFGAIRLYAVKGTNITEAGTEAIEHARTSGARDGEVSPMVDPRVALAMLHDDSTYFIVVADPAAPVGAGEGAGETTAATARGGRKASPAKTKAAPAAKTTPARGSTGVTKTVRAAPATPRPSSKTKAAKAPVRKAPVRKAR